MSSSSHKRHRRSQHEIHELLGQADDRKPSAEQLNTSKTQHGQPSLAKNQPAVSTIQDTVPDPSSHPTSSPPCIQDMSSASAAAEPPPVTTVSQLNNNNNNTNTSEPSTLIASDLSTLPSTRTAAPPSLVPIPHPSLPTASPLSPPSGNTNRRQAHSNPQQSAQPSLHGNMMSSTSFNFSFNLCQVRFGTQTSPPKSTNLLSAIEDQASTSMSTTNRETTTNPDDTTPPQDSDIPDSDLAGTNASHDATTAGVLSTTGSSSASGTSRAQPVGARLITEGTFLLPLRRIEHLACKVPGPSLGNVPLIVVTPQHQGSKKTLTLTSGNCAQLMRRAKNFTNGVARSPTGKSKERRYNKQQNNKRKQHEIEDDGNSSQKPPPQQSNSSLHLVTSFSLTTLLIEDIWFLKDGTPVALFFHDELLPPRYSKKWLDAWEQTLQSDNVPTVRCQGRLYKQVLGWVNGNPDKDAVTGFRPIPDVIAAMSETQQHGIFLKLPIFGSMDFSVSSPPL